MESVHHNNLLYHYNIYLYATICLLLIHYLTQVLFKIDIELMILFADATKLTYQCVFEKCDIDFSSS